MFRARNADSKSGYVSRIELMTSASAIVSPRKVGRGARTGGLGFGFSCATEWPVSCTPSAKREERDGLYRARFAALATYEGKFYHLGVYPTLELASNAFKEFTKPRHGEFF